MFFELQNKKCNWIALGRLLFEFTLWTGVSLQTWSHLSDPTFTQLHRLRIDRVCFHLCDNSDIQWLACWSALSRKNVCRLSSTSCVPFPFPKVTCGAHLQRSMQRAKERTVPSDSSERTPSPLESAVRSGGVARTHSVGSEQLGGSCEPPFQWKHLGFLITHAVSPFIWWGRGKWWRIVCFLFLSDLAFPLNARWVWRLDATQWQHGPREEETGTFSMRAGGGREGCRAVL